MCSTKALAAANWWSIAQVTLTAAVGIAALAGGFQGWALIKTNLVERILLLIAGFALVYPSGIADLIGFGFVAVALTLQVMRRNATVPR